MSNENQMPGPGCFSWNELTTTDVEGACAFYGKLFGWTYEEWPNEEVTYRIAKSGDRAAGGIMSIPAGQPEGVPPNWMPYVTVENVDDSVRKAGEAGGRVLVEPMDIPSIGRFAVIQDPQGAVIGIATYLESCQ